MRRRRRDLNSFALGEAQTNLGINTAQRQIGFKRARRIGEESHKVWYIAIRGFGSREARFCFGGS